MERSKHNWIPFTEYSPIYDGGEEDSGLMCTRCGARRFGENEYENDYGVVTKGSPQCDPADTRLTRYRLHILRKVQRDEQEALNDLGPRGRHAIEWLVKGRYIKVDVERDEYGTVDDWTFLLTWRGEEAIAHRHTDERGVHDWKLDSYTPDSAYSVESWIEVCTKCGATRTHDYNNGDRLVYGSSKSNYRKLTGSPPCVKRTESEDEFSIAL